MSETGVKPNRAAELLRSGVRLLAPLIALLLISVVFALLNPSYLRGDSISGIGEQAAVIVIVGIGETLIIIAGGIDLSVGSVMAFSGTFAAVLILDRHVPPMLAAVLGTLVGGLIGLFNGVATVKTRLHPFIITLGSMMIFRGLALALTHAQSTGLLPGSFAALGNGEVVLPLGPRHELVFGPVLMAYIVVIGVLVHVMLTRTRTGRYCFAIGSNPESVRLSGVRVDRWMTLYFVLAGLLFGFAGVVQVAKLGIGDPKIGEGVELEAIAAAVIGGSSLSGGQGSVLGTILGAFLMAALRQGLGMVHLDDYWQKVSLGAAIIVAVVYDRASRRKRG